MPFKSRRRRPTCNGKGHAAVRPCIGERRHVRETNESRQLPRRRRDGSARRRNAPTSPSRRSPSQAAPGGPSRAGAVSGCPSASDDACRPRIPIGLHFNGRPCVLARPTLPKASSIAMPYAVRLNPDPPAGRTGSDGLKFRMATSGIRAGALLCRSGTAWVSDRIQTRVYRRRPLSSLEEHDAKSQEHPNDKRSLVTHTLDDGRSSPAGRRASLTPPIRPPIAPSLRRPGSPIPARQRGRLRHVHAPDAPAASADPVRPPALPDRYRRPTLGRGFGAVPGAGERGPRRDTGAQRTICLLGRAH